MYMTQAVHKGLREQPNGTAAICGSDDDPAAEGQRACILPRRNHARAPDWPANRARTAERSGVADGDKTRARSATREIVDEQCPRADNSAAAVAVRAA